jgi:crotonobetainyl-CoA:carnitine CoA-transferase CaiB-like acyl-CoA transferase
MPPTPQALKGLTVLDLSTRLPGPLATLMLAQAGARVIKIERPPGEEFRSYEPQVDGVSAHYAWLNRGKECLALDFKIAADRARFDALLGEADILVEQFRPGVMDRLGLGYGELSKRHPKLIYCAVTGYGRDDPRSLEAAHDLNYQASAGLAGSAPPGARGVPALPAVLLGDIAGGTYPAFMSILLAVLQRNQTGRGQFLDIAMARNVEIFAFWSTISGHLTGEWPVPGTGRHTGGSPRYNLYAARDGRMLAVGALEDRFWQNFLDGIGLALPPGLESTDPRAAIAMVAQRIATQDADFWLKRLEGRDTCCNLAPGLAEAHATMIRNTEPGSLPRIPLPIAAQFTDDAAPLPAGTV